MITLIGILAIFTVGVAVENSTHLVDGVRSKLGA
jgi:hypothetical protein